LGIKPVMTSSSVTVTVPATTANIGPGFDCLGAALTLQNRFVFKAIEGPPGTVTIQVEGEEAERVATNANNLVYQAFTYLFQKCSRPVPAVAINISLGVPLARGLGSSSTAIVGGLIGANCLAHQPFAQDELIAMAIAIEGHPDNVVPALVGGCQLAALDQQNRWTLCDIPWHNDVVPVLVIPSFELSTQAARQVLPESYSRADAIFNTAHLGLLQRGLATGNGDWLRAALDDRIHQPYRKTLIPGYDAVAAAALAAGAFGLVISGAGPTLLALAPRPQAEVVRQTLKTTWAKLGQTVSSYTLALNKTGAETSGVGAKEPT
jgi:homoserine kinase